MNAKRIAPAEKQVAYSVLTIKAVDSERREITGIATTPEVDRMGDIVVTEGVKFKNPLPLLWQHDAHNPVGLARFGAPTKDGIPFTATLPKVAEEGKLKELVDYAWHCIKYDLVRGVSIGFRPLKYAWMDDGGIEFQESEVYELSAVTIPANASATIDTIKSIDGAILRAASGSAGSAAKQVPGDSGQTRAVKTTAKPKPTRNAMNYADSIKAFEDKRKALVKERQDIQDAAAAESRTKSAEEQERFEEISAEIKSIDTELKDLKVLEEESAAAAQPVNGSNNKSGAASRERVAPQVKAAKKLDPGIAFARAVKCLALGYIERRDSIQIAKSLYAGQDAIIAATQRLVTKAAVNPATTADSSWAGALVGDESSVFADFVEYLRPQTILGRFGVGGIPSLRRVPFRVPLVGQTSGGAGYWVGEGNAKPLTKFDFERSTLEPLKVANIAVATMEVIRDSSPSADTIIRDQLAAALRERLDIDFIDPAKAAAAGVSPASILNGISGIPSSGNDADAVRADLAAIFAAFIAGNNAPTSGVWIMPATTALALSLMRNPLGQAEFPGITMNGGTLAGLPVIVSEYVPSDTSGAVVALVNAQDIYLADEGDVDIDMSTEASLQMSDSPDNPTTAATVMVSLWQRNLVGFRAERTVNWKRRRSSAVAYLTDVLWGAA